MTIIFYHSRLCPRCRAAGRSLRDLCRQRPDLRIEEREFLLAPLQALRDGITMIPAIKIGDQVLSGVFLGRNRIAEFLGRTGCL
jgi:hypothetical protein